MAFQRADGQALQVDTDTSAKGRPPELADLAGQTFMVNGRAFSGTGVGYNPLAAAGQPRLSARADIAAGNFQRWLRINNYGHQLRRGRAGALAKCGMLQSAEATIGVGALPTPSRSVCISSGYTIPSAEYAAIR